MSAQPTASKLLSILVRVAEVISPSHATAVARYAMQFVDMDSESPEFQRVITLISMSLIAEIDVAITSMDMAGMNAEMALIPYLPEHTDVVKFREEASKVFDGIRMVDGFFTGPNNGDDDFWP